MNALTLTQITLFGVILGLMIYLAQFAHGVIL